MKIPRLGALWLLLLAIAPIASADPCGSCQAFYPCELSCELCVEGRGGPGLWMDGSCWGEIAISTCGESGQCDRQGGSGCSALGLVAAGTEPFSAPAETRDLEVLLEPTEAQPASFGCWYTYQLCQTQWCNPDDSQCLLGCECSYYQCVGLELPSYCIY